MQLRARCHAHTASASAAASRPALALARAHPRPAPRTSVRAAAMSVEAEIIALNQKVLNAIAAGDYATYAANCDPSLTCFEPEALGHLVEGLPFHEFYFKMPAPPNPNPTPAHVLNTMGSPNVRVLGDVAILAYVRLTQKMVNGAPVVVPMEETRVFHKKDGKWLLVHLHRSPAPK